MYIIANTLFYVMMVRFCVNAGYQPRAWSVVYAVLAGLAFAMAQGQAGWAVVFAVVAGAILWLHLELLSWCDRHAAPLLWWALMVIGMFIPLVALGVVHLLGA